MCSRLLPQCALAVALAIAAPRTHWAADGPAATGSTPQQWGGITMFHGLPSPSVRAIAQDSEGILWFGTDGGLVRYDGQRLERIPLPLPARAVRALAVDANLRLWVGTDAGAFVRRKGVLTAVAGTEGHSIGAIAASDGRQVWLGSAGGTVFTAVDRADGGFDLASLGPEQARLLRGAGSATLEVSALLASADAHLLGTLGRGLLRLRGGEVSQLTQRDRPFFVTGVIRDETGRVYLASEARRRGHGVHELVAGEIRTLDVPTGPVSALAADRRGTLWLASRGGGLLELRNERLVARHTFTTSGGGLLSNQLLSLCVDRDGVLWIGTDRGVSRFDPRGPRQERLDDDALSNFVHALLETPTALWAGTHRGLFVRETGGWRQIAALGNRAVYALASTPDGRLLAGTASGLYVAPLGDAETNGPPQWTPIEAEEASPGPPRSVRAIRSFHDVLYVASFGRGLERLDGDVLVPVWPPDTADAGLRQVTSLSATEQGLWIGTAMAGSLLFRDGEAIRQDALSERGALFAVVGMADGSNWAATAKGLLRLTADGLTTLYEGDEVRALLPAAGPMPNAWCGTARSGVIRVGLDPDLGPIRSRIGTDYGLPSDSVFAIATGPGDAEGNEVIFGTNRGVVFYEPARIPPGLRLVHVFGRRAYAADEWSALRLEYPQSSLLVHATATGGRTYPEHFQYLFTLTAASGVVLGRTLSSDGQFSAQDLDAGAYRIEARALGIDLVPSPALVFGFEVGSAPVPWPSIALGALLLASLAVLGWGSAQNRKLQHANQALHETRLQLAEETESERRRIARDLHDQTLADLRRLLLTAPAREGQSPPSLTYRESVEAISTEVRRICEDLSPSVLENVGLTAALEWALGEALSQVPAERGCRSRFICGDDVEERIGLDAAARIQVYRIIQEALANAVRHAEPKELLLGVELAGDGTLAVVVEDDGGGFAPERAPVGRGLANIRSRASLIGARVSWSERDAGGTRFRLEVPAAAPGPRAPRATVS